VTRATLPDVRVYPDLAAMSSAAAELILSLARQAVASRGRFAAALSGGSTPRQLYLLLAASPYREALPWQHMHVFWADERCVPPDHNNSNYRLANETFLAKAPIPAGNVHRIRGEAEPGDAARQYEGELAAFFGPGAVPAFDLVLLGIGEDGHTASLFPGSSLLRERTRLAMPVPRAQPAPERVTLTLPVLNAAAQVIFLAAGASKASILHEVLEDGNPKDCPAGLVKPLRGSLTWMLDRGAAEALTGVDVKKE